tara:strand:+ start:202 stop:486 length:285 start_codon:yes stop_codon:yes gene_type:complete
MNSCINEINNFGFRYYLLLFQKFIDDDTKIIVDNYGGGEFSSNKELLLKYYEFFYNKTLNQQDKNDYLPIAIFKKRRHVTKHKIIYPQDFLEDI